MSQSVLVVGLGEVGMPLFEIVRERHDAVGVDIDPVEYAGGCDVLHICYGYGGRDFVEQTVGYVEKYLPELTIIDSTVAPGTTRAVFERTKRPIVHSPVRGKHIKMKQELLNYVKFIGGISRQASEAAADHFHSLGMTTRILSSPEATELAKLTETTYFGLLISWAQEVERYCDGLGMNYDEVVSFYDEIGFFPQVKYFSGVIGGHCVMPNIGILEGTFDSEILKAIRESNERKVERESARMLAADF